MINSEYINAAAQAVKLDLAEDSKPEIIKTLQILASMADEVMAFSIGAASEPLKN